jgi:predicted Zn-dependent peptidase
MELPIETYTLDNGLRVILSEDHTAPIVAVNLWYDVGSAHEKPGRTGFAHLFEHMLFQGSEHVGANEHFELVQRAGGTLNGSTWLDRTNYFETVPSHQLGLALWLEADRMGRLLPAMTQEKLDTQRDVVKNERRWSMDNQPYGTWWEKLPALAFEATHPFHHSLIGSMDDLDAASLDDVQAFFRTWYTPDNAVLTIAGDFDPTDAKRMVAEYFGPIPRGTVAREIPAFATPARLPAPVREVVPDDVPAARVFVALRVPVFGTPGHYHAAILAAVLGARKGSRLYRGLVRDTQVAAEVGAYTFDLSKGSDLLVVDAVSRPEVDAETLEAAVHAELDRLQADGVTAAEVARAQALVETDLVRALQSAGARADRLSQFATYLGDPHRLNDEPAQYRAVTAASLTAFVREHCTRANRATLVYVPRVAAAAAA